MIEYKNVYVAACDEKGGIYHYVMDENGNIEFRDKTDLNQPTYLKIYNGKMYVTLRYMDETKSSSAIVSLDILPDGSLSKPSKPISTLGEVACHLCVNEDKIFAANYISGSVFMSPDKCAQHTGSGVNPIRQDKPHCHFTEFTPDKKYVLVCDLGLDTVFTYDLDLNVVSTAKVPDGKGCRHIAFSDDGKTAYCVNELSGDVSVFSYNDGKLKYLDTYAALPADFSGKNTAAAIRYKDGFVYASNRGHDSIAVFKTDGDKLEKAEFFSCEGKGPRDININGDYMFSTNEQTNNVTMFILKNGKPEFIKVLDEMPDPLCVIFN